MGQPYGPGSPGFGILSAIVLVALLLWCGLAIWVARHPGILDAVGRIRSWATEYLDSAVTPLARWLSVDVAAAVGLLSGMAVVALLTAGFTELLDDVLEGQVITYVDQPVSQWLAAHRELWLTATLKVLTHLGDAASLAVIVVAASAWAGWRIRSWLPAVLGLSGLVGIGVVLVVAKVVVGRTRPPSWIAVIVEDGFSFPSGHATGSFGVAVLVSWMVGHWLLRAWTARVALWAVALAVAGLIGFSRIYLGVHYVSDVVAGAFLGAAWAVAVVVVGEWWESRRRSAQAAPSPG
ncbi:phosphatase PAP2 family protein [Mycolicibacterium sphagni]|uniref:Phosphatidic acid phosphatase type 2/haloperoxidase domain-containing protein n=1 Tax=Mycolicibacterium sphagni TaxID=1786 RepID=A0A255DQR9_9MYCO|nr:phosphatase PAP2 family protein [Mycolicibacterium sphagni]OYN79322.1 hypothetical protein CG716_13320 [Mycolicibacterium sphagni]